LKAGLTGTAEVVPSDDLIESQKLMVSASGRNRAFRQVEGGLGVDVRDTVKVRDTTVAGRVIKEDGSVKLTKSRAATGPGTRAAP